jgi:putative transposase
VTGGQQRSAAAHLREDYEVSERRAAKALGRSRSTVRYRPKARSDEAALVTAIRRLVRRHPRYGYRRIRAQLVAKGWAVNVKRVRRLMVTLGCQPRKRRKSKGNRAFPGTGANGCTTRPATAPNDVWTCDFIHDRTISGGSLKWLSVVDEYTREVLLLEPASSMTAADVRRAFGRLVGWRGKPKAVRCDNGGEFVGSALAAWLPTIGTELMAVAPASPWQNGYVESFHGKLRDEFLNLSAFADVVDAKAQAAWFKREYNTVRPHSGLGYRTPKAYAATCGPATTKNSAAGGNPPVSPAAGGA